MSDSQATSNPKPTAPLKGANVRDGFTGPIKFDGEQNIPAHIHPDTLMAKGVDPGTKELITVNLLVLQHQHGPEKGLELYKRVARVGKFFDPNSEPAGSDFYPDLQLEGMASDVRANVDAILNQQ